MAQLYGGARGKQLFGALMRQQPLTGETAYQYSDYRDYIADAGLGKGRGLRSKDKRRIKTRFKRATAAYESRMEQWRQRSRRTTVTQQGVQRRAFFEQQAPASGGMRTTTGAQ